MGASVFKVPSTGAGPINDSYTAPAGAYRIISIACVFDAAPTTSENFTITLDDVNGSAYDVLLYTLDPSAAATTDIVWQPDQELMLATGDKVTVAFTKTDANVYGLTFTMKRV